MIRAVDTSVIVAGFASWHEQHEAARRVLDGDARLIEHCALETYSVLTRLPAPQRMPGAIVLEFLRERFVEPWLRLSAPAYRQFLLGLAEREIAGGASYDALVAATAATAGAELITCDRRAAAVYEACGVRASFL